MTMATPDTVPIGIAVQSLLSRGTLRYIGLLMFTSRWLQAPLYGALIVAQALFITWFVATFLHHIGWDMTESDWILVILSMIDAVMVSNLLIMVIIGGFELFVSRIKGIEGHPDKPNWLAHINSNILKLKVAMAIIGISSIDMLRTFVGLPSKLASPDGGRLVFWQVILHTSLVASAMAIAWIGRISDSPSPATTFVEHED